MGLLTPREEEQVRAAVSAYPEARERDREGAPWLDPEEARAETVEEVWRIRNRRLREGPR